MIFGVLRQRCCYEVEKEMVANVNGSERSIMSIKERRKIKRKGRRKRVEKERKEKKTKERARKRKEQKKKNHLSFEFCLLRGFEFQCSYGLLS
jgi:hypothetical protein